MKAKGIIKPPKKAKAQINVLLGLTGPVDAGLSIILQLVTSVVFAIPTSSRFCNK